MACARGSALSGVLLLGSCVLGSSVLGGCGWLGNAPLTRTVGGAVRTGIFVSPYSYEHFLQGELAYIAGDYLRAAEEYRLARAGPEDDVLLIARLADCLDRLDQEAAALALLREGEALDRDSELLWLAQGEIHARRGRVREATEALARASAAAPDSEAGPLALAALLRSPQPTEADAVLERYLARATRMNGAGAARARLRLAVARGDAAGAAEAVRRLLEIAPARADEVRAAAVAALDAGRPDLAQRLLLALPDDDAHRALRLRAALDARDHARAEAIVAGWMPEGPDELARAAEASLALGHAAQAAEIAELAVRSEGGAPAALALGRALRAAGRPAEAARVLAAIEPGSQAWPAAPIELAGALSDAGLEALAAEVLEAAGRRRGGVELALALADARLTTGDEEGALRAVAGNGPELAAARARVLETLGRDAAAAYAALPPDEPRLSERDRVRASVERRWAAGARDDARALLEEWVERAPEDLGAATRLARIHGEGG